MKSRAALDVGPGLATGAAISSFKIAVFNVDSFARNELLASRKFEWSLYLSRAMEQHVAAEDQALLRARRERKHACQ